MQPRRQRIPTQPSKLPKNTPKNTRETSKKDSCFTVNIQNFFFWKYFPKKILHLDRFLISTRLFLKNHQTHTAQESQKKILTNTKTPHFSLATKQNTSALRGTRAEERIPERETYRKHLGPRNRTNQPTEPTPTHQPNHTTQKENNDLQTQENKIDQGNKRIRGGQKNRGLKKIRGLKKNQGGLWYQHRGRRLVLGVQRGSKSTWGEGGIGKWAGDAKRPAVWVWFWRCYGLWP